jgi:N-acetylglucosaminyldiphosphoundecaprenol N-acetyl-beta-D-mannosaminyltransferase
MNPSRVNFLGCPMDLMTSQGLLEEVQRAIDIRSSCRVVQFVNANKVARVADDPAFGRVLWQADYVLTDGQPMVPLARLLGIRVPERIDGIGLMGNLLKLANQREYRVYLWGATQETVEACAARILRELPQVRIAGYRNGYFRRHEATGIAREIASVKPDILFLGMGSPLKEELAEELRHILGATVIQGVGGSFDVMAGLVRRAPVWVQRMGMEWFYRVVQEPRRMFWRYAATNTRCLTIFFRAFVLRLFRASGEGRGHLKRIGALRREPKRRL